MSRVMSCSQYIK